MGDLMVPRSSFRLTSGNPMTQVITDGQTYSCLALHPPHGVLGETFLDDVRIDNLHSSSCDALIGWAIAGGLADMRGWLVGRPGQAVTVKDLTQYLLPLVRQFDIGFVAVVGSMEAAANLAADRATQYRQIKPIAADCAIIQSEESIVKDRLNKAIPRVRNLVDRRASQVASFFPELHLEACPIRRKLVNQLGRSYGFTDPLGALAEAINSASFQPESINHIAGDYRDGITFALTEGYMNGVINEMYLRSCFRDDKIAGILDRFHQVPAVWLARHFLALVFLPDGGLIGVRGPMLHTMDFQLHSTRGPAVIGSDGDNRYYIRGVQVPAYLVVEPGQLTPRLIDAEPNPRVKAIMMEIYR
jgi:hypothetical protein